MEQSTGGAIPKKFSRNVLLLKNGDFPRINDRVYMPTASEISKLKHSVQLGQFKRKVEFDASMSEDRIKKKLDETFPYLVNRRFSCAAVVKLDKDSSKFEFHGSPRPWSANTIRSKIKGNSALYILEDEVPNSATETSTTILASEINQVPNSATETSTTILASEINQMTLLDETEMEIDESPQGASVCTDASHASSTAFDQGNGEYLVQNHLPIAVIGGGNITVQNGNSNVHQNQQMSDMYSTENVSHSDDNATTSGISGSDHEYSQDELSLIQWLQENLHFQVSIRPTKSPLEGGDPVRYSFIPELHPAVTSGHATYGNLGTFELERRRNGSLDGTIPASPVPGKVPVKVESQNGIILGWTEIEYIDEVCMEEALQQIVENPNLQERLFVKYMYYSSGGNNPVTNGGETQNSATLGFTQPVQMLSLLVYAAAESGAQQFIEMIFTSSAGRVVYDAYKDRPLLPEVIAKKYGNEKTANYLQEITKRFSEEIRTGQECSHIIDWSELVKAAEAAQKQLGLTSEENYQLESDVSKETGYLGDAETSPSESSDLQSSDSDDDISTTFRKADTVGQQGEIQLERNHLKDHNEDTKDQHEVEIKPFAASTVGQEDEIQLERNLLEDHNEGTKDQHEVEIRPFAAGTVDQEDETQLERNILEDHNEVTKDQHEVKIKSFAAGTVDQEDEIQLERNILEDRNEDTKDQREVEIKPFADTVGQQDEIQLERKRLEDHNEETNDQHDVKPFAVPPEILARGDLALEAYHEALAEGKTCVKRVPIMLIGQGCSGKTSLKKSLKGERFNPDEDSTVGIDVDPSHFKVSTEIWKAGEKNQVPDSDTTMSYEHHAARLAVEKFVESVQPRQSPLVDDAVSSRVSSDFTLDVPSHVPSERQKNVKRAEKEINQELEDLYQLRFGKDEEMSIQATTAVTENTVLLKKYPYDEVTSKEFGVLPQTVCKRRLASSGNSGIQMLWWSADTSRAMFKQISKVASTAVVDSSTVGSVAHGVAAAIDSVCGVAIALIQKIGETERVQQQEKTKRQKQKELTITLCFAIFALCVVICFVAILMAR